ncbi:MAG: PIN domain-containing protein [Rhodanobacteraceae bacterium]
MVETEVIAPAPLAMIMLDTHIAVAFYDGRAAGLSAAARRLIDAGPVLISPAVLLEMELLHEIGRLRVDGAAIVKQLRDQLAIRVASERFADVVSQALDLRFTRDPFDRLIVAHALLLKARLATHDETLKRHYPASLH